MKEEFEIVENKSPNRVHECYKSDPKEWNAQYDMLLPDNITCKSCVHCDRCVMMFGQEEKGTSCQFSPSKFKVKV